MDRTEIGARIAAHIDRNHPRLGSALMKLRWGGLRTVQPDRGWWAGIGAVGVGMGVASRSALGRRRDGRHRLPVLPSVLAGVLSIWAGVWRLDSIRWRRSHVTLELDLPADVLDELIERLRSSGVHVERHDGPRRVGGAATGLSCRLRDLRRVNRELDLLDASSARRVAPTAAGRRQEGGAIARVSVRTSSNGEPTGTGGAAGQRVPSGGV